MRPAFWKPFNSEERHDNVQLDYGENPIGGVKDMDDFSSLFNENVLKHYTSW